MRERLRGKWDALRSRVGAKLPRLSRPWRTARNLVCIPLAVYLIWLFLGGNPLTARWAFRREEKMDLVGPSEILWTEDYNYYYSTRYQWLLGETEHGYTSVTCRREGLFRGWSGQLSYWPRGEKVTLILREGTRNQDIYEAARLYLFCEEADVLRAEADITIRASGSLNGTPYDFDRTYTMELTPNEGGILSGVLLPRDREGSEWSKTLEEFRLGDLFHYTGEFPVTVRLYGAGETLLDQVSFLYSYADPE